MTESVPFDLLAIDHVVLRSANAPFLVQFYVEGLGCKLVWDRQELGLTHLSVGDSLIDIVDVGGPLGGKGASNAAGTGHNVDHICLRISPFDIARMEAHFLTFGVQISAPIDRFGARGYGRSVYLTDPDGNGIELKENPRDSSVQ